MVNFDAVCFHRLTSHFPTLVYTSHFLFKGGDMKTKYGLLENYDGGIDLYEFREMVAVNAYYRAGKRGFKPGYEMDDWFEAEKDIKSQRRYCLR
jgi:hypothetical protein